MKTTKKQELLKHAYENFPEESKFSFTFNSEIFTASGKFQIIRPEQPKSILEGRVAIHVNNEREFKLLMEHYGSKGWSNDILNESQRYTYSDHYNCYDYHDNYRRSDRGTQKFFGYKIIPFADFAKEVGIEVPVFVMKSEDGVDLYEGDDVFQACNYANSGKWIIHSIPEKVVSTNNYDSHPKSFKYFSTKEAAETWIGEQNKPKDITIRHNDNETSRIYKDAVTITSFERGHANHSLHLSGKAIEEIYAAYKSLQE